MFRHECLHTISWNISKIACSYPKWLALTKKTMSLCIYIYTSIILKVSSIVCFRFVVIMSSCSQSTCNTILVVAATINSCAMSALIDDYKAK